MGVVSSCRVSTCQVVEGRVGRCWRLGDQTAVTAPEGPYRHCTVSGQQRQMVELSLMLPDALTLAAENISLGTTNIRK